MKQRLIYLGDCGFQSGNLPIAAEVKYDRLFFLPSSSLFFPD
jgi:hypothetical protein